MNKGMYENFIENKTNGHAECGFKPIFMPDFMYDFQKEIPEWSLLRGRSAIFAECGLGKTPMQLVWAENILRKHNKPVLILTPLAVAQQTVREGKKFGIEVNHTRNGKIKNCINVTNYQRLHYYNPNDFIGIVNDESSILKNFAGKFRQQITTFMDVIPYRLLCTATPAPNDHMELGTSSEALGIMKRSQMLSTFFVHDSSDSQKWRLKGHADNPFWEWMASWCRTIRKPSDIGFDDKDFILPKMDIIKHTVKSKLLPGRLFVIEAKTLNEQRKARRDSINDRVGIVADIANQSTRPFIAWCELNDESSMLVKAIPDAVEITGSQTDEIKEKHMLDFSNGKIRVIVTKPKIAGFGMNWQHCSDMSFFPSHSHEQFYQASRRCWRFGQKNNVKCHIVTSESESAVVNNLKRKENLANEMFNSLVVYMKKFQKKKSNSNTYNANVEMFLPEWIKERT